MGLAYHPPFLVDGVGLSPTHHLAYHPPGILATPCNKTEKLRFPQA